MSLDLFQQWLTLNCEESNTIKTYYRQIQTMLNSVSEPLTQEKLNDYFIKIINSKSKSTFNTVLNSVRKYLEFTKQTFELPKQKGIDKRVNKFITQEELQRDIIPHLVNICPKNYMKAELVIKVLFLLGLRKKELLNLKRSNINLVEGEVELINTKGNVNRTVPMDDKLNQQMKQFFDIYPEENNAFNITIKEISIIFEKLNSQLKFKEPFTPRLCRHSCAIHLIRQGLDVSYVQKVLGHKDIDTTMIYAEPDFTLVKEAYRKKIKGF